METQKNLAEPVAASARTKAVLKWLFCIWVLALAVYQFSENTADPDLWGHTLFGLDYLQTGNLAKTEPYSWTAAGTPWINHEVLSEVALAKAFIWKDGAGILLLKIAVGLLTFLIALHAGTEKITWPSKTLGWIFGAVALVEISFGFAPRPQIFTALALALTLWFLKKIHDRSYLWVVGVPIVFVLWINTHGGVLAGVGLLGLVAVGSTIQFVVKKRDEGLLTGKTVLVSWIALVAGAAALLCNPWGAGLVKWLIDSVLWLRPEIDEWNPTPLNWDHAALFILIALSVFSWICSRKRKHLWELLACIAFAVLALRSVRNTPLFAIVALATVPEHLVDACLRFRHLIAHREDVFSSQQTLSLLANFFWITLVGICTAAFFLRKDHPLTIEVPKKQYPVSALTFIKKHGIHGNLLVFFDWGEMCLWELPSSPVSIDGRLDTCYPRNVITNHWQIYNALPHDTNVVNLEKADFALLPASLQGGFALAKQPGWKAAYVDDTAVVLVRDSDRFPALKKEDLPVIARKKDLASEGRAAFPEFMSDRISGLRTKTP